MKSYNNKVKTKEFIMSVNLRTRLSFEIFTKGFITQIIINKPPKELMYKKICVRKSLGLVSRSEPFQNNHNFEWVFSSFIKITIALSGYFLVLMNSRNYKDEVITISHTAYYCT